MLNPDRAQQAYTLNKKTLVTITSKRSGTGYIHKVALTHTLHTEQPLRFDDKEKVAELIENIDLSEEQRELDLES
jgi:hypothetical protein